MMPVRPRVRRVPVWGVGACRSLPSEWWDTDDDGSRLALAICRSCPERRGAECVAGRPDDEPAGVIRAGVAYNDRGIALPLCECGYPQVAYAGGTVGPCPRCVVPDVPIPDRAQVRARAVRLLIAADATDEVIAAELRVSVKQAGVLRRAAGLRRHTSRPGGSPTSPVADARWPRARRCPTPDWSHA
ncbi:hypothetical protein [Micromonospora sp. DT227]|uniref:hypothetical protein n=1 Tax=Micromonospora sp. DT227 TaxID=3393433 RepID=UPI003CF601D4